MGKTTRWFRSLLGAKKSLPLPAPGGASDSRSAKDKNSKRGLVRSFDGNGGTRSSFTEPSSTPYVESVDANKHAIAVAAATAAVAEAALAAAQAAAEVVRLTSGGSRGSYVSYGCDRRREWAAVVIQSGFRAYLARRALKALKALVKLQALVRGHIVRKQSTHMLQRMQAMSRIQARACAHRAYMSESPHSSSKSSQSHQTGVSSPKTFDHQLRAYGSKINGSVLKRSSSKSSIKGNIGPERTIVGSNWLDHWMEENSWNRHRDTSLKNGQADDEKSDKILEVDTWKPHMNLKQGDKAFQSSQHVSTWTRNEKILTPFDALTRQSTISQRPNPGPSQEFLNLRSLKLNQEFNQAAVWAAENSPGACSASSKPGSSSRRGPLTPARSELSRSFYSNYMGHPNYMANTESSQAKVRSQSAPRQRIDFEKPGSTKRFVRGYWDEETSSDRGWPLHGSFRTRAYPGSGRSDKLGMPFTYSSTYGGR